MNVLNNLYFQNCGPVLEEVTDFPLNPKLGLTVLKDGIVYTYTKINGISSWYPLTNKTNSYIHSQGTSSTTWEIHHNLNTVDILFFTYDDNHNLIEGTYEYVDNNTFKVNFTTAKKGIAVLLSSDGSFTAGTIDPVIPADVNVRFVDSDVTAANSDLIVCKTEGATIVNGYTLKITLPSTPTNKDIIRVMDGSNNGQNRPVLVQGSHDIVADDRDNAVMLDTSGYDVKFVFNAADNEWSFAGK